MYSDSKDLVKRSIFDKYLKGKAYEITRILNIMDVKEHLRMIIFKYENICYVW